MPNSAVVARVRAILSVLLVLSLVPAIVLCWNRIRYETTYRTVAVIMDYPDLVRQARAFGMDEATLLKRYQGLGVDGVAVYEATLLRLVQQDRVVYRDGSSWRNERLSVGQSVDGIRSDRYYLRSLVPGAAEAFRKKYRYPTEDVTIDGKAWIAYPIDVSGLPAGPDTALIDRLNAQGLIVAYRPFNPGISAADPGADFPSARRTPYLVYGGDEVTGYGDEQALERVRERTGGHITALIEATDQSGMDVLAKTNPIVRLFAIRPEWQALLQPDEVASKFVLAARERNHGLLYVRPFARIDQTDAFLNAMNAGLEKAGIRHGRPAPLDYEPNDALRAAAAIGPVLALALLATTYPWWSLGALVALGALALTVAAAGLGFDAAALLAGVVFPALGFALYRRGPWDWLRATMITMMGALFIAGVGPARLEVLALAPFRGVALTLVMPPLLLAVALLPRQDVRKTIRDLWNTPVSLGTFGLALVALAAVALVVLRRGNTPAVGVSATEAKVRAALQDTIIRPRTKEVLLHPAAIVGLTNPWPVWFMNLLLLAGVIGQGSIVDTFAHYHTPLLISLQRTVYGVVFGAVLGVVATVVVRVAQRVMRGGQERVRAREAVRS